MPNLTDRDIDRLSRAAAEFHEPDDAGLSWSKFEQQFRQQLPDKPPGRMAAGRLRPYLWGSVILTLTGLTYFFTKPNHYSTNSTLSNGKNSIPGIQRLPLAEQNNSRSDQATARYDSLSLKSAAAGSSAIHPAVENPPATGTSALHTTEIREPGSPDKDLSETTDKKALLHSDRAIDQFRSHNKRTIHYSGLVTRNADGKEILSGGIMNDKNGADEATVLTPGVSNTRTAQAAERAPAFASLPDLSKNNRSHQAILSNDSLLNRFPPVIHTAAAARKSLTINRSLVIGVVAGPDYTNGGGITNDQLSDNFGLSAAYYLTNRLSVNTGLIYTRKYYWTKGDGFRILGWPGIYFPVELVNGSCNMWEIPLTMRYDFPLGGKTTFFVDGGVSSYLMTKEDYTVFYHNGNRIYGKEFESAQHHNYLFSVVNVSAGFERQMGRGFSFQAEPFMKMPTQGMGLGNIKLNSYGLLFSFRYAPALKKSRR